MNQAAHLLKVSNDIRNQQNDFELSVTPTKLELQAGMPGQIEGLTPQAVELKGFAEAAKHLIKSIGDTHFRVFSDQTLNDGAKLVRSADHAGKKIEEARSQFMRLAEAAKGKEAQLTRTMKEALKPPASAGEAILDQELRALAKKQKDGELPLVARNTPGMVAAIARAPAVLSGIAESVHATLQNEHMKAVYPDEYAMADDLKKAFNSGNTGLASAESLAKSLIDFDTAKELGSRKVI